MPIIKAKKLRVRKNKDSPWADVPAVVNGAGGTSDHSLLANRDAADQHPISSIAGLQKILDEKQPAGEYLTRDEVFPWARAELFDKSDLVGGSAGISFVTIDGVEYCRYHAGQGYGFTWTNPNPQTGAVTITARGINQYNQTMTGGFTSLIVKYSDGTDTRLKLVNNETVSLMTDASKVLSTITGNYDLENWVLLDMSVMSCIADYPAPSGGGTSDAVQYVAQTLTDEQKAQARENIGASPKNLVIELTLSDDNTVTANYSSTEILEHLNNAAGNVTFEYDDFTYFYDGSDGKNLVYFFATQFEVDYISRQYITIDENKTATLRGWNAYQPPVTSVNGKTGDVTIGITARGDGDAIVITM